MLYQKNSSHSGDSLLLELSYQLLSEGKSVRFKAPGRSMYPTIRETETITVEPIVPQEVKVGDIVLYRFEESVVAHRVMRIEREEGHTPRFILREDTWGTLDDPVTAEQILGRVISVERAGRTIDPYSTRAKVRLLIHTIGSRLKRYIS